MTLSRRSALAGLALAAGANAFLGAARTRAAEPIRFTTDPFALGVASGEPGPESLLIWTRIAPEPLTPGGGVGSRAVEVRWTVAADEGFRHVLRSGRAVADPGRNHSVHVKVRGLPAARPVWYRFEAGGVASPVGRASTLPAPGVSAGRLRLAVASCQHFEQGLFSVYRDMIAWQPDLILHLGDYIYESRWGPLFRHHPGPEPVDLMGYRTYHAAYRMDPDLRAAHAACPWLFVWDDHDVANDWAGLTPEDPALASTFPARRAAAWRAWFEAMPLDPSSLTRNAAAARMSRAVRYGDLVDLILLDTRQHRTPRACVDPFRWRSGVRHCPEAEAVERTQLGAAQERWLASTLARSDARWTVIGQPSLFSHWHQDDAQGRPGAYQDGWSAYPAARRRILGGLAARPAGRSVVLGGDMHAFFASDVKADFDRPDSAIVAAEFVTSSVTSHSFNYEKWAPLIAEPRNAHIRFMDDRRRGWLACDISRDAWRVRCRAIDSVQRPDPNFSTLAEFAVERGVAGVQPVASPNPAS